MEIIDKEKIVTALEDSYKYSNVEEEYTLMPQDVVLSAIALLKEREVVVRCKDCVHLDSYYVECKKGHNPKPPYDSWFCADGKER